MGLLGPHIARLFPGPKAQYVRSMREAAWSLSGLVGKFPKIKASAREQQHDDEIQISGPVQ
jgi:hypothetical protein